MNKYFLLSVILILLALSVPNQSQISGKENIRSDEAHRIFGKAEPLTFLKRSEGPFIRLSDGGIFSIQAEKREVSCSISKDEGITWTEYPLFDAEKFSVINPVFVQTRKGTIIIAFSNMSEITPFTWNNDTNRPDTDVKLPTYIIRSKDNGKTWSEPLKLHDDWTGFNRTIIETKDGHIVLSTMIMRNNPSRHCVLTYVSSDDGATWTPSTVLDSPSSTGHHAGLKEADIIQLNDGRLWMVIRTNWDYFYESYSSDNGLTWSAFCKTDIDSSSSPCGIIRLQSGRIVMVWNRLYQKGKDDIKRAGGDKNWSEVATSLQRDELSLMYSDDDGKTWSAPFIIAENSPQNAGKWLSYPYLFEPKKGVIWITTMQGNLKIAFREDDLPK